MYDTTAHDAEKQRRYALGLVDNVVTRVVGLEKDGFFRGILELGVIFDANWKAVVFDNIVILGHGNSSGHQLFHELLPSDIDEWTHLGRALKPEGRIILSGCWSGTNTEYVDQISQKAGRRVFAPRVQTDWHVYSNETNDCFESTITPLSDKEFWYESK